MCDGVDRRVRWVSFIRVQHLCDITRVQLFNIAASLSEVFWKVQVGDLRSVESGLYSLLFSVRTMKKIAFAKKAEVRCRNVSVLKVMYTMIYLCRLGEKTQDVS